MKKVTLLLYALGIPTLAYAGPFCNAFENPNNISQQELIAQANAWCQAQGPTEDFYPGSYMTGSWTCTQSASTELPAVYESDFTPTEMCPRLNAGCCAANANIPSWVRYI